MVVQSQSQHLALVFSLSDPDLLLSEHEYINILRIIEIFHLTCFFTDIAPINGNIKKIYICQPIR